uniref:Fibrinogen C-terminal domain-containing protein n=1 Tax=Amphimedon queenslandica TaxID=400682 RepID=A0A1X7U9A7_AMPQE
MIIPTFVCLCIIFSQVNAQSNTFGHCKEEVCCNQQANPLLTSCKDIKRKWSDGPTGYYQLSSTKRGPVSVYCNMDELCGSRGEWTRLGYLNMADPSESCPSGFRLYQSGGVRACGRQNSSVGSCVSLKLLADDISYSQVCGRVVGYQYASNDAVDSTIGGTGSHNDINSYYVDGVSITRGFPRQHVWTLMGGANEAFIFNDGRFNCPCSQGSTQNSTLQSFIGNDYFCESGNPATDSTYQSILYTSDPLWDGEGCGSFEGTCCAAPGLPWFHKKLNTTTTDYLELRVCGDERTNNEDTPISFYEIYVK